MLGRMAIEFRCDYCGRQVSLADSLAGQETSCPNCGVTLHVPGGADGGLAPTLAPPRTAKTSTSAPCPYCGEELQSRVSKCPHCGEQLGQPGAAYGRDPGIDSAATLSLVLGLIGILLCAFAGPFAIWQGGIASQKARAAGVATPGTATAGIILGWITVALFVLGLLFFCAIFGLGMAGAAAGGGGRGG